MFSSDMTTTNIVCRNLKNKNHVGVCVCVRVRVRVRVCVCVCVSTLPLTVTCIFFFGYPGNRRKSQNLSASFFSVTSHKHHEAFNKTLTSGPEAEVQLCVCSLCI